MEPRIHAEYSVVDDVKPLREKLASTYKSKLKLKIIKIRQDLSKIKVQDGRDDNNNASWINLNVKNRILCSGPSNIDTDANMDTAKTIAKMSEP